MRRMTAQLCIAAVLVGVAVMAAADPADAQNRRWCTQRGAGSWGFPDCSYDTFEQCRASASGTGRFCTTNSWYVNPQPSPRPKQKVRRRYRQ